MHISEDRISHIAHKIIEKLWRDDLADITDEARALNSVKDSITAFFAVAEEIDQAVRKKLASYSQAKGPGKQGMGDSLPEILPGRVAKKKW